MPASRSKTTWKTGLVVAAALAMGTGGVLLSPSTAEANPTQSVHRTYYNASFTNIVGGKTVLKCGGGSGPGWGQVTNNYVQTTAPCSGGYPPFTICYMDGFPWECPPGV